ncbi:MAG TPA: SDR family oxidoreductase [Puia sp.]|nr:SDR family oxidoreductase [Puia sp.]
MNLDLTNKTALVCGASQGLGAATVKELASLGATVYALARNEDRLKALVSSLDVSKQQQHGYISADTSQPVDLKNKINTCLGNGILFQILVNNTGGPPSLPLLETKAEDMESAFRSHLSSAHILSQLLVPGMKKSGYGRIINIVSTSVKQPIPRLGISNTVRAAVANWAKTLSEEVGRFGITVNNILPGYIKTDRLNELFTVQANASGQTTNQIIERSLSVIPAGRLGEPQEIAAAIAFLCSPAAAYINGINLPIDGGRTSGL